jgi:hypothetical protein
MPLKFHYSNSARIPPMLLVADDGYYLTARSPFHLGSHGYDPNLASMKAVFLGMGPRLMKKSEVLEFQSLDIYELMAILLNVPPAKNDGSFERAAKVVNGRTACRVATFQNLQLKKACGVRSSAISIFASESDSGLDTDLSPGNSDSEL